MNADPEHPSSVLLRRVTACVGWAVHGLVFEFLDGHREGGVLDNGGTPIGTRDDAIEERGGIPNWTNIDRGDYITRVYGRQLGSVRAYLCYSLTLVMNSGREISFSSRHHDWCGANFEHSPTQYELIRSLCFGQGWCHGYSVHETSIHLPVSHENAQHLPRPHQKMLLFLLIVARRVDDRHAHRGDRPIGTDVWWLTMNFLVGHDLQPSVY